MANYKKIADVTTVSETTENMNVLIEDNGLLKKISATKVGGGNSGGGNNIFIITTDSGHLEEARANMDYATLQEAFDSGNPIIGAVVTIEGGTIYSYDFINNIELGDGGMIMTTSNGVTVNYNDWSDYPTFGDGGFGG